MKKPAPIHKEVPFGFDEQFFSTTDERGVIVFGNEVFVRISGYHPEQIIGAPHNIIRHPDMPRAVFKLFWKVLKINKPVAAYVKNMAVDGSYYWVFAFAFPVDGGFLSIRFRPSSDLFLVVKDLYAEVLRKEKTTSMDEAEVFLLQCLKDKGFESYEDFMIKAITLELKSHEEHLAKMGQAIASDDSTVRRITEIRNLTSTSLNKSFSKVTYFEESSKAFSDKIHGLADEFKKLKFLSMNMNIMAANIGDKAATLSTISEEFARLAGQIETQMLTFGKFTDELLGVVKNCSLNLGALKSQMNMVDFFLKESIMSQSFEAMAQNKDVFTGLFQKSVVSLSEEITKLRTELDNIAGQIFEVQKFINGLQIIKQTGSIESARRDDLRNSFNVYLQEMSTFIAYLRSSITELNGLREGIGKGAIEVHDSTSGIKNNINELFRLALMKK